MTDVTPPILEFWVGERPACLDDAIHLHEEGRWHEAERIYESLLRVGSEPYETLLQLALLRTQQGQVETAVELLRQAIVEEPRDPEGHSRLGAALLAIGRNEEAIAACDRALAIDAEDPLAHYNRGVALQALDRPSDALTGYERAIAIEGQFPAAHYNLGTAFQALGDLTAAMAAFAAAIALKPDYEQAYIGLGGVLGLLGRHEEAAASFESALKIDPGSATSLLGLSGALMKLSRDGDAISCLERAIAVNPTDTRAYVCLAKIHSNAGRLETAAATFESASAIEPNNLEILLDLARAFTKLSRHDEAITCYNRSATAAPNDPRAYVGLGDALRASGRNDAAIAHYERALLLKPERAEILNNLGIALAALGRQDDAAVLYRQALTLTPDVALLHNNLATTLDALNQSHEALASYERALSLDPDLIDARLGFANVLGHIGRFDEAHQAFEEVIGADSKKIAAYHGLGLSKRFTADDPYLAAMETFSRAPESLSDEDSMFLHFALAKASDDLGQHQRAFSHLLEGNRIKRRQLAYDEANALGFMDRCREFFTPGLLREKSGCGDPSRVPVFIVGMMRSGSTLVEQILASHPQVFGGGERPNFEQSLVATLQSVGVRHAPTYLEATRVLDDKWIDTLALRYLGALTAVAPTAPRITDKLLGNFINVGLIHLALPNARIIHTHRDPLDTCLSCFSKLFAAPIPFAYDLAELGRYYRAYERLMAHWREVLPEGVMIDVRYEDVVDDLDGQARRIVAHCGLEWDKACLAFHRTERPVRTASAAQVRQPIYRSSIGRARRLEEQLRPLIEALGDEVVAEPAPANGHSDRE